MRKIQILAASFAFLIASGCSQKNQESEEVSSPNIIVVLVDDMRWDEYGEGGHNYLKTPNIDRVAKEGVSFKNAFTTTPLCSPSRASFLTGQYAHANGITDNLARNEQSHKLETFPKFLNGKGYETAFIGKWHMGNDDTARPGFDHWVALKGQGEAIDPNLNVDGERITVDGYVTDILTDYALKFVNKERSSPFLLYLSQKALHPNVIQKDDGSVVEVELPGFIPAERHKGMYANEVFERRPNASIPPVDKPALARKIEGLPLLSPETSTKEQTIRERAEMLMAIDDGLGQLMQSLEDRGALDNTIIVFTSDHGYWYGEHCLDEERRLAYEEAIRIPMLIRYPPAIKQGSKIDQMVLSIDLAPTLVEMAGQKPAAHIQGKSLLPVINNTAQNWRTSFLVEYYSDTVFPRIVNMGYKAVRNERYKYIHYVDLQGMDELYDLETDPYELQNRISDPEMATVLQEMKEELNKQLTETGATALEL